MLNLFSFITIIMLITLVSRLNSLSLSSTSKYSYRRSSMILATALLSTNTAAAAAADTCDRLNPLKNKDVLPRFNDIQASDISVAITDDINTFNENFAKYEKILENPISLGDSWGKDRLEYSYPMVVEELEKVSSGLSYTWSIVSHLMGVKNSEELRKVHDEIQPQVISNMQKVGQSKPLFNALSALKKRQSVWRQLSEAQQRVVTASIRSMESSGVGLNDVDRELYNKLELELAELKTTFSNNVLDSTKAFKFLLTNKDDLDGLPSSSIALAAQAAQRNGHADATPENGPWLLTLDMPSYLPSMQHLKSREIREKLYRAFVTRASELSPPAVATDAAATTGNDNSPVIKRILQIKHEMSNMLGYKSYADKSVNSKMAETVENVEKLLEMLHATAYPAAQKDLMQLEAFAKKEGVTDPLTLWDIPYYSERMREKEYSFSEEELRPYLAFETVLDGLFALAKRLFGITIVAADGEEPVWHKDVRFFKIYDDKSNEHISSFFVDPFSRPAEKRGGAWMDVCVGKSSVLNKKPVAYLICNGSPPLDDTPSLMTFREVTTLFHEFGHCSQHLLTTVKEADAAGINGVEWDAVELPSQWMENWCYDKKTLFSFANHYKTNEPMPVELFNKVEEAKNFQSGLQLLRQVYFASMDMQLYSKYDPYGTDSVFDMQHQIASKYTVIPPLPEDRFLCSFSHIFAGGYSAGYYSYKWAEVMSADAFEAFEEVGLDNDEQIQKLGRKFRDTVLSLGGGRHPSKVFEDFRGRQPSPNALLRHSGLISK